MAEASRSTSTKEYNLADPSTWPVAEEPCYACQELDKTCRTAKDTKDKLIKWVKIRSGRLETKNPSIPNRPGNTSCALCKQDNKGHCMFPYLKSNLHPLDKYGMPKNVEVLMKKKEKVVEKVEKVAKIDRSETTEVSEVGNKLIAVVEEMAEQQKKFNKLMEDHNDLLRAIFEKMA